MLKFRYSGLGSLAVLLVFATLTFANSPPRISLSARSQPLSVVLAELKQKTGITVERQTATDPPITLELKDVGFWEALDQIARQANVSISLYERSGELALVDGLAPQQPVSYSGVFRTSTKKIASSLDLRSGKSAYSAVLELAWEPGFRPFYLECRSSSIEVRDENDKPRSVPEEGTSQYTVTQRNATEFEVALPSFPRSVARIGLFKGTLLVLGTPRMARFNLGALDKVTKGQKASEDQATLTVRKVVTTGDPWSLQVELGYPQGGPHFESYQSWLIHNELYLEGSDGKTRLQPTDMAIDRMTDNSALVTYYFKDARAARVRRGDASDWRVVCTTPARLLVVPVPFELKNVPLP